MRGQYTECRTRLARIRCLGEALASFKAGKALPYSLCYVCKDIEYKCSTEYLETHSDIKTHAYPISRVDESDGETSLTESLQGVIPIGNVVCDEHTRFYGSSEPIVTYYGLWLKIFAVTQYRENDGHEGYELEKHLQEFDQPVWILARSTSIEENPFLVPVNTNHDLNSVSCNNWKLNEDVDINSWLGCVEANYSMSVSTKPTLAPADEKTIEELRQVPTNWSSECDEQLVNHICQAIELTNGNLGTIKNFVDEITVSSCCGDDDKSKLVDGNPETFWESDGSAGCHFIRLKMKRGTVISRLYVTLDMDDDNYLPNRIVVTGGEKSDSHVLSDVNINLTPSGVKDECVLQDMKKHYPYVTIWIKSCKDEGIDTRIRGLKILSTRCYEMGMSLDLFGQKDQLVRYPALQSYAKHVLYRRAQALQRLVSLLDTVINFLVPSWCDGFITLNLIQDVKQLLPLSAKRLPLIDAFIKDSESSKSTSDLPRLMINRRAAAEHRSDPNSDPEGNSSVFNQIYEGLKPRNNDDHPLDYRWPSHHDQWWECKFVAEGIIDQGGGFRDSLCDMAEELCPPSPDDPVPLPYFIRAPNQLNADTNASRDVFVPNPSCTKLPQYRWIGKLMGACLRCTESLVLMLPAFIWKKLTREKVCWNPDFASVDSAEVRILDNLEGMTRETFEIHCSERTWSVTLSDGTPQELRADGLTTPIAYDDRLEYARLAKEKRMSECDNQIDAIREGLLEVVPEAVLNLLTWQEVDKRICGDPEITVDGIRRSAHFDEMDASDERIKMIFEVMDRFSNDDRSKFLRFVTGRKRLPCPLYISPYKSTAVDCLPESSTCSNTLYLPRYTSLKIAEEKLRYAAFNCVAIDTDINAWE